MRYLLALLLPANGDVLTPTRILMVGCSTWMRPRARVSQPGVVSTIVSPTSTSSVPARAMISPAPALSAVVRRSPSNVERTLTVALTVRPSLTMPMDWLAVTVPATMRPMASRPT